MESTEKKRTVLWKRIVTAVLFLALLACLLFGFQEILRYKWEYWVTAKYNSWESQAPGSIDVIFFSSSNSGCAVCPMVLYNKAGITAFHWGQSWGSAPVEYFLFKYCMKAEQQPKLVVIDARDMFMNRSVDCYKDPPYRRFMATMPDKEIRAAMLEDILTSSPKQKRIEWVIPLFAYHTRWSSLETRDFIKEPFTYKEYQKGCSLEYQDEKIDGRFGYADSKSDTPIPIPDSFSVRYYNAIAAECAERGIQLAVVTVPERSAFLTKEDCTALRKWCDSVGALYWDYLDPKYETGIPMPAYAFANNNHLNPIGATLFSLTFADTLASTNLLPDHRGEAGYESWDNCYSEFLADFPELKDYLL